MAKITLNDLTTNFGSQTLHNTNNAAIEDALNNKVLYRDNPTGEPNQMENELDMNSNKIVNLEDGVNGKDAVNVNQLNALIAGSGSVSSIVQARESQLGSQAISRVFTFTGITYAIGVNTLSVYRNGQRLEKTEDYTETSTSSITLTFDPNDADRFVFVTNDLSTSDVTTTPAISHTESGATYTLSTYLQNRHVINVKDYGAVGDGVTDDSSAIQAAITASSSGDIIYFPASTYLCTSSISITTPLTLQGEGQFATFIKLTSSTSNSALFDVDTNGFFAFDIRFESTTGKSDGNSLVGISNVTSDSSPTGRGVVERCRFVGFSGQGFLAHESIHYAIKNCLVTNCGNGIEINQDAAGTDSTTVIIENNYVTGCDNGIYLVAGAAMRVKNNIIENCGEAVEGAAIHCRGINIVSLEGNYYESNVRNIHMLNTLWTQENEFVTVASNADIITYSGLATADRGWINYDTNFIKFFDRAANSTTGTSLKNVYNASNQFVGFGINDGTEDKVFLTAPVATTTELADITDDINTGADKVEGYVVYNETTGLFVVANGAADGDTWKLFTGTVVHTPA